MINELIRVTRNRVTDASYHDNGIVILKQVCNFIDALLGNGKKEDVLEVEGLEWRDGFANGYGCGYLLHDRDQKGNYYAWVEFDTKALYIGRSLEEAKAACQDHHNKRVLEQIKLIGA
jgi:hypothetical protein